MVARLDKILAGMCCGSRKDIKALAKNGAIKINGKVVKDTSVKIDTSSDIVEIEDKAIELWEDITIMLNKPAGYVSSNVAEGGYPPVTELIDSPFARRLKVAGRLDADSVGLLLLTTSGEMIHNIIKPGKEIEKTYFVSVRNFDVENSRYFHTGIEIEKGFITKPAVRFEMTGGEDGILNFLLGITEGKFHQVKRMFSHFGAEVIYLKRVSIGGLVLDDALEEGSWRRISDEELKCIFKI